MFSVSTEPARSLLLRKLGEHLPAVIARLDRDDLWYGACVAEGGATSQRLLCEDRLLDGWPQRTYAWLVHRFPGNTVGEMHDHRWPLAVLPFAEGAARGAPLYDMPWEDGLRGGVLVVRAGVPYAMERPSVRHAVHSRTAHMSIVIADVTDPPARENRLSFQELGGDEVRATLARARAALTASKLAGAPAPR